MRDSRQELRTVRRVLQRSIAVSAIAGGALLLAASPTAAADGCGTYSFGFEGTRLMNDGISTEAGPFPISLPAGTYDVTLVSNDNHPTTDYQVEQTQEQWYVVLDNGYVSAPSADIPAGETRTTTTFTSVEIDEASAISVKHLLEGGINSVNVECVGFTPVEVAPPVTAAPVTVAPTTEAPVVPEEPVVTPVTEEPAKVIAGPATTTAPPITAAPTTAQPTTTAPPTTAAPAIDEVTVEVLPAVETEITALAITGPEHVWLAAVGLLLVVGGVALIKFEDRLAPVTE